MTNYSSGVQKSRMMVTPRQSDAVESSMGSMWAHARDVPPVHTNRYNMPSGEYWEHMQAYVYDRGAKTFPSHVEWRKQCPELKAHFIRGIRKIYPGNWESKGVLEAVGKSIREKRARLRAQFKVYRDPKKVGRPNGCTFESWNKIWQDIEDPKKKEFAAVMSHKVRERLQSGQRRFSHRCGRKGYDGIVVKFVSYSTLLQCIVIVKYTGLACCLHFAHTKHETVQKCSIA
ncbi:hypothetical protein KC19_VG233300 [Ceratodon purpureus]|uniref:Uncharacterized protein n=1 Tax=Ceratodon purpureus TaxID=3225 RepID=A0A8T0HSX4_CERPU|nr:hypothetical protein KC19_VG233300 [Ceratodon purpureus]